MLRALSVFFALGVVMIAASLVSLAWPGSFLEPMWSVNPRAYQEFAAAGWWTFPLMSAVAAALAVDAIGLWKKRRWAITLAIALLAMNLLGDAVRLAHHQVLEGLVGVGIASLLIALLIRQRRLVGTPTQVPHASPR